MGIDVHGSVKDVPTRATFGTTEYCKAIKPNKECAGKKQFEYLQSEMFYNKLCGSYNELREAGLMHRI